jgi:hypothetical protein
MRGVVLSLLAVIVGVAMVGGGVWGLYDSFTDDDDDSTASASTSEMKTSSSDDCSAVAERDPRFRLPHDLQFGAEGKATVQCKGNDVSFTIAIPALKDGTFYEVYLQRGRRKEEIGTFLEINVTDTNNTVTVTPDVKLKRYDFLVVRPDSFHNPGVDQAPFRAAL